MGKQYFVVEVLDPSSVEGVANIYVEVKDTEEHRASVRNGFKSLASDGQTITGVFSRVEIMADGTKRRLEPTERVKTFARDGFRTMSAFLRA